MLRDLLPVLSSFWNLLTQFSIWRFAYQSRTQSYAAALGRRLSTRFLRLGLALVDHADSGPLWKTTRDHTDCFSAIDYIVIVDFANHLGMQRFGLACLVSVYFFRVVSLACLGLLDHAVSPRIALFQSITCGNDEKWARDSKGLMMKWWCYIPNRVSGDPAIRLLAFTCGKIPFGNYA